jgi:glycosyltransferase involved in cell wall biosynthesis
MSQRLLFITPKIKENDDDFSFCALWARAFERAGFDVVVICLEKGNHTLTMPVYSLGREKNWSRLRSFLYFQWLILTIPHDRVFVHMNPRWLAAGAWLWFVKQTPTYLWYTHYTRTFSMKIGDKIVKRLFAATKESLPQYEGDPRKIILGHGIDTDFWDFDLNEFEDRKPKNNLLAVHRISRSKRIDLVIKALKFLPKEYTLTHFGRALDPTRDPDYEKEIRSLAADPDLAGRVTFMGSRPMPELKKIYPKYSMLVNLVPGTIDKTVLEAMYCGVTPVITRAHADAIGYPDAPVSDEPEDIAKYILEKTPDKTAELRQIVTDRHDLNGLIKKMSEYIKQGD